MVVIAANIIQFVISILCLYVGTIINRRLYTKWYFFLNAAQAVVYFVLNSYRTAISCVYACCKHIYTLVFHKEEKITFGILESTLLTIPYFIIGIVTFYYTKNWFLLAVSLGDCLNSMVFCIKNEVKRQAADLYPFTMWMVNDLVYLNYVGAMFGVVSIVIIVSNIVKVMKHGEEYYYSR